MKAGTDRTGIRGGDLPIEAAPANHGPSHSKSNVKITARTTANKKEQVKIKAYPQIDHRSNRCGAATARTRDLQANEVQNQLGTNIPIEREHIQRQRLKCGTSFQG